MSRIFLNASFGVAGLLLLANSGSVGQTLKVRPPGQEAEPAKKDATASPEAPPVTVAMSIPSGTPIKVALDSEVRIRVVGQPIHGKTTEPVYAFDKLLIPVGTPVNGKISAIDAVSKKVRTLDAMDANFSPVRAVHVQFDELVMRRGLWRYTGGVAGSVLRFVPANEKTAQTNKLQEAASKKVSATRQQIGGLGDLRRDRS